MIFLIKILSCDFFYLYLTSNKLICMCPMNLNVLWNVFVFHNPGNERYLKSFELVQRYVLSTDSEYEHVLGDGVTTYSVFWILDGHNGAAAAIYTKDNLLNNVLSAIPADLNREEWIPALARALVAGFIKTDKDFQEKGQLSGKTVTFVIIEGFIVTVASVGDPHCIRIKIGSVSAFVNPYSEPDEEEVEEKQKPRRKLLMMKKMCLLYDAFSKYQTKPKVALQDDVYHEGQQFEVWYVNFDIKKSANKGQKNYVKV